MRQDILSYAVKPQHLLAIEKSESSAMSSRSQRTNKENTLCHIPHGDTMHHGQTSSGGLTKGYLGKASQTSLPMVLFMNAAMKSTVGVP